MHRLVGKLVMNGNSTQVTIQRRILYELGWIPGECVVLTALPGRKLLIERLEDAIVDANAAARTVLEIPDKVKV